MLLQVFVSSLLSLISNVCLDENPMQEQDFVCGGSNDFFTGEVILFISMTRNYSDFAKFLKTLDVHYPTQNKTWVILDCYSAHALQENRKFLVSMPEGKFQFVLATNRGSWLNMHESFVNKLTKQMLRRILVSSKVGLEPPIY